MFKILKKLHEEYVIIESGTGRYDICKVKKDGTPGGSILPRMFSKPTSIAGAERLLKNYIEHGDTRVVKRISWKEEGVK